MAGCLGGEDEFNLADGNDSVQRPRGWQIHTQDQWDEIIGQETAPEPASKDPNCDCSISSIDPQCDYFYFPAANVCSIGGLPESYDDMAYFDEGQIENTGLGGHVLVNCGLPYGDYYGFKPEWVEQVVFVGINEYSGEYDLECNLYSSSIYDANYTYEVEGEASSKSSSVQSVELEGFDIPSTDPLLALNCWIPPMYWDGSNYDISMLQGFRVCVNPGGD